MDGLFTQGNIYIGLLLPSYFRRHEVITCNLTISWHLYSAIPFALPKYPYHECKSSESIEKWSFTLATEYLFLHIYSTCTNKTSTLLEWKCNQEGTQIWKLQIDTCFKRQHSNSKTPNYVYLLNYGFNPGH